MSYDTKDYDKVNAVVTSRPSSDSNSKTDLTEEQELILKGIRPKDMPQWQFKLLRKALNIHIKKYLKGQINER